MHRLAALLAETADHDVVRLDHRSQIGAAYPFSAAPTTRLVAIDGGPTGYAVRAVDTLGIADMLGRNTTITSGRLDHRARRHPRHRHTAARASRLTVGEALTYL